MVYVLNKKITYVKHVNPYARKGLILCAYIIDFYVNDMSVLRILKSQNGKGGGKSPIYLFKGKLAWINS